MDTKNNSIKERRFQMITGSPHLPITTFGRESQQEIATHSYGHSHMASRLMTCGN